MTLTEYYTEVNYALRGIDDDAPAHGTEEAEYWLATLNRKISELYQNPTQQWSATYDILSVGTITATATPTFDLDTTFVGLSDQVYVVKLDGQRRDFDATKPQERSLYKQEVFVSGYNPQKLNFTKEILSTDDIVGGELFVPGYYMPAAVADEADVLPLPDAYWGVMSCAAEIAGNDLIYEDKEANLVQKANNLYRQMDRKNKRGTFNNPRKSPTNVTRIRNTEVK